MMLTEQEKQKLVNTVITEQNNFVREERLKPFCDKMITMKKNEKSG